MVVENRDGKPNGQEEACDISLSDVELETCPTGTALVDVAVPDDNNPLTFPDVCNLSKLDKCISGDLAGAFVTDTDGNTFFDTTLPDEQEKICDLPEAEVEVCADDTPLAGIVVENRDTTGSNGDEVACNPFEICPEKTALAGVAVLHDGKPETDLRSCSITRTVLNNVQEVRSNNSTL